jgi:hypothetical protein
MPDVLGAAKVSNFFVIMSFMRFPTRINGLYLATILLALYGVIWISLEGGLKQAIGFGAGVCLVGTGHLIRRSLGGRFLRPWPSLAIFAGAGLLAGSGSGLLTLLSMVVKTGLHGHGPEFTQNEIEWVIRQIPVWGIAGILAGLGVGFLLLSYCKVDKDKL